MIAYDELVAALAQWRIRKGLPILNAEYLSPVPGGAAPAGGARPAPVRATPPRPPPMARPSVPLAASEVAGLQGAARTMADAWTPGGGEGTGELDASQVVEEVGEEHELLDGDEPVEVLHFPRAGSPVASDPDGTDAGIPSLAAAARSSFDSLDDGDEPPPLAPPPSTADEDLENSTIVSDDDGHFPR